MRTGNFDPRWAAAAAALGAKAAQFAGGHHGHGRRMHGGGFGWGLGFGPEHWGGPGPWGPRGPRGRRGGRRGGRARKGDVRAAILALLAEEPRNGYQIIQEIAQRSDGAWKPSPGAVYPALQQLADEGLVISEESGGRKTFSLTDEGRAYVEAHADELSEPWAAMAPEFGEGVPDLFRQAAQTGAAVMQVVHTGSPEQIAQAREILAEARRKLYHLLADDTAAEE
ncbi:PadR family transcriptional regulator [Thermomonospora amylolytica]|uniref:PadR family transcriptional regulator n=1 Tax=Thermomonospora amylolytica TaxID=1411117 RepID=UPI000E6C0927|nr:PadR family transcriptional regulator [Thermomonospora amylolytica]